MSDLSDKLYLMAGNIHDATDGSIFMDYELYNNTLNRGGFDAGVAKSEGWYTERIKSSFFAHRVHFRNEAAKTMFLMKYR